MADAVPEHLLRLGLGIDPDLAAVRRAYAQRLKLIDQQRDPQAFAQLRADYERAVLEVKSGAGRSQRQGLPPEIEHPVNEMEPAAAPTPSAAAVAVVDADERSYASSPREDAEPQFVDVSAEYVERYAAHLRVGSTRDVEAASAYLDELLAERDMQSLAARERFEAALIQALGSGRFSEHTGAALMAAVHRFEWMGGGSTVLRAAGYYGEWLTTILDQLSAVPKQQLQTWLVLTTEPNAADALLLKDFDEDFGAGKPQLASLLFAPGRLDEWKRLWINLPDKARWQPPRLSWGQSLLRTVRMNMAALILLLVFVSGVVFFLQATVRNESRKQANLCDFAIASARSRGWHDVKVGEFTQIETCLRYAPAQLSCEDQRHFARLGAIHMTLFDDRAFYPVPPAVRLNLSDGRMYGGESNRSFCDAGFELLARGGWLRLDDLRAASELVKDLSKCPQPADKQDESRLGMSDQVLLRRFISMLDAWPEHSADAPTIPLKTLMQPQPLMDSASYLKQKFSHWKACPA